MSDHDLMTLMFWLHGLIVLLQLVNLLAGSNRTEALKLIVAFMQEMKVLMSEPPPPPPPV